MKCPHCKKHIQDTGILTSRVEDDLRIVAACVIVVIIVYIINIIG